MPFAYSAYGLRVLADGPIPGLLPCASSGPPDVCVRLNRMPPWWEDRFGANGAVWHSGLDQALTVWKLHRSGWYRLIYRDGTEFLVNPFEGEIWSAWPASATVEDSATYLVGPVLGFVLRLRNVCCLHASAITIGRGVVAFSGPPGAGKSTTAAAFAEQGYPAVSDDIAALTERDGAFWVRPGYPRLCLWPDSPASLNAAAPLPRISPVGGVNDWWDKRYVDLMSAGRRFQTESLPLRGIYLLEERTASAGTPKVEPIQPVSAVVKLAANTYMNYLLDRELQSEEFRSLSRLVSRVPVRRVIPHTDPSGLPRLREAVLQDYAALPKPASEE